MFGSFVHNISPLLRILRLSIATSVGMLASTAFCATVSGGSSTDGGQGQAFPVITRESILTQAGAIAAVVAVANTIQYVFNFNPKWLALVISIGVAFLAVIVSGSRGTLDYIFGILNGCVIFCGAVGVNTVAAPAPALARGGRRTFNARWFE